MLTTCVFLSQEFLEGGDLFDRIVEKTKYSERDASFIIRQITSALSALHSHGIIHRDMKPENILFSESRISSLKVKIADFGCGLVTRASDKSRSVESKLVGTPGYIAPEVLGGNQVRPCNEHHAYFLW